MKEQEPGTLQLLIEHELALKQLYEVFAVAFPARRDLWLGIAGDEQDHADWLGALRSKDAPGKQAWFDQRFKPQAIRSSIRYVEQQATKARESRLTQREALSIARDLENALIEKQFSRMSESLPAGVRSVLSEIAAATEGHRQAFSEALAAEKQ